MRTQPPRMDSSTAGSSPGIADRAPLAAGWPAAVAPTDHDLTIIIPALNEEQRLPWTLNELDALLKDWNVSSRVLVVDDGSSDGTAGLTDSFGPHFSTIRLPQQRGKGNAVRTAMLCATGRVVAFTDADLPFDLGALRSGFEWIRSGQCQVVFGARDIEQSANIAPRRLARRIATFAFREIVSRLVSREVTDTQCGLKLFSRRAALELFSRTTIDGFAFDAEVVLLTHLLEASLPPHPRDADQRIRLHNLPAAPCPADAAGGAATLVAGAARQVFAGAGFRQPKLRAAPRGQRNATSRVKPCPT